MIRKQLPKNIEKAASEVVELFKEIGDNDQILVDLWVLLVIIKSMSLIGSNEEKLIIEMVDKYIEPITQFTIDLLGKKEIFNDKKNEL